MGLFSKKKPDPLEYQAVLAEIARRESMIGVLEKIEEPDPAVDVDRSPADRSVTMLRATIKSNHLASAREELVGLRARAAEMLAEDPWLEQVSADRVPPRKGKAPILLISAILMFVIGVVIATVYKVNEPTITRAFFSTPEPGLAQQTTPVPIVTPAQPTSAVLSPPIPTVAPTAVNVRPPDPSALYAADWSRGMGGWPSSAGWSASDQMLKNDGSDFGDANWVGGLWNNRWVAAPYVPEDPRIRYAVEVEAQILTRPDCGSFGLVVREGYQAGVHLCSEYGMPVIAVRSATPQLLVVEPFDPGTGWRTYRLEARGSDLRLLVDGILIAEVSDEAFGAAGRVGLWDDHTPLAVRQFRVVRL